MNTLTEDKSRLETLCKRFKVQLTDTRKLLSAMKSPETSTTKETPSPAMEEPDHVKSSQSLSSTQPMVQKVKCLSLRKVKEIFLIGVSLFYLSLKKPIPRIQLIGSFRPFRLNSV